MDEHFSPEYLHIKDFVRDIIGVHTEKGPEDISDSHSLEDDLDLDSLDIIDLTMDLDGEFDINISDEEMVGVGTVEELVVLVYNKKKGTL